MFIIDCPKCEKQQLVTNKSIVSVHRTSEGMVGYVRCPSGGHVILHRFEEAYPNPKPPASVIALREAQRGEREESAESKDREVVAHELAC